MYNLYSLTPKVRETAIEYGLIAALIAVAIIGGARTLGTRIGATFNNDATFIERVRA